MTDTDSPRPIDVERHPAGYRWSKRAFEDVQVLLLGEGVAAYAARGENAFWIIEDEGTLADFLPDDDPLRQQLIRLERYEDAESWTNATAAIVHRAQQNLARPGRPPTETYQEKRARWQSQFDQRQ